MCNVVGSLTSVSALALGLNVPEMARTGVHDGGLLDHETILDELSNVLSRVSVADLVNFIRVQPHLSLATLKDRGSESVCIYMS